MSNAMYILTNRRNISSIDKASLALALATNKKNLKDLLKRLKENHNRVKKTEREMKEYLNFFKNKRKSENISKMLERYNQNKISEYTFMSEASKINIDENYKRDLNKIINNYKRYSRLYDIQCNLNYNNPEYYNENNRQYGKVVKLAGKAAKNALSITENVKKNYNRKKYKNIKSYYEHFGNSIYSGKYPINYRSKNVSKRMQDI